MSPTEATPESAESVAALSALYQAERQSGSSILLTALALIAAALTYLGVAAILINNTSLPGGAWVSALLALPLYIVTAYHVLLVASALVTAASTEIIEAKLVAISGLTKESDRANIGSRAVQQVMNVDEQPCALRIQTFVSYGGVGAAIIAFTVYCLIVAAESEGWVSAPVITAVVAYILLAAAALTAWLHVLGLAKKIKAASVPANTVAEAEPRGLG